MFYSTLSCTLYFAYFAFSIITIFTNFRVIQISFKFSMVMLPKMTFNFQKIHKFEGLKFRRPKKKILILFNLLKMVNMLNFPIVLRRRIRCWSNQIDDRSLRMMTTFIKDKLWVACQMLIGMSTNVRTSRRSFGRIRELLHGRKNFLWVGLIITIP